MESSLNIDPATRLAAERVFAECGLTLKEAIDLFLRQSIQLRRLPFNPVERACNATTRDAIAEARNIVNNACDACCWDNSTHLFCELDKKCSP